MSTHFVWITPGTSFQLFPKQGKPPQNLEMTFSGFPPPQMMSLCSHQYCNEENEHFELCR